MPVRPHNVIRLRRWPRAVGLALCCWALWVTPASAIVSSNDDPASVFNGVDINLLVGAPEFYLNDYWGGRAIIANVEAGHVWNGHSTLEHVTDYINHPSLDSVPRQYDLHATAVGQVLAGRDDLTYSLGPGVSLTIPAPYSYFYTATSTTGQQFNWSAFTGLAPMAALWSSALATQWVDLGPGYTGQFETDEQRLAYAYQTVMQEGLHQPGRKADVVNSSWGFTDPAGAAVETRIIDALAYANRTTVVIAAGNNDGAKERVGGPASGYNVIAVAALASDTSTPVYGAAAGFSNNGPNDFYNPKTHTLVPGVRAAVDIAAPGDNLTAAYYGGLTGGNAGASTDPSGGSGYYYLIDVGGTSFAAPVVAGGAALLTDVGHDLYAGNPAATDGRVIKAVLLNAADKTAGWTNAQTLSAGVVTTTQGLDYDVGAGALNLARAFYQYTDGTADLPGVAGGTVANRGWDFAEVAAGQPNVYFLADPIPGGTFSATLTWFANRLFNAAELSAADVQLANLDLEVWSVTDGQLNTLVAQSVSDYNNVEHLFFDVPAPGDYALRVLWKGEVYDVPGNTPDVESYGLAWDVRPVPEPSALLLMACAAVTALFMRQRRNARR